MVGAEKAHHLFLVQDDGEVLAITWVVKSVVVENDVVQSDVIKDDRAQESA